MIIILPNFFFIASNTIGFNISNTSNFKFFGNVIAACQYKKSFKTKCVFLEKKERDPNVRIDRSNWVYNKKLLQKGYYVDSHMLRPYALYKKKINRLLHDIAQAEKVLARKHKK